MVGPTTFKPSHALPAAEAGGRLLLMLQALGILIFLFAQYTGAWQVPFLNEDYAFLDVARGHSFLSLWSEPGLRAGPWFRPWSQGLHYWALQHVAGHNMAVWHGFSFCLVLVTLLTYSRLVHHVAGSSTAAIASAAVTALVGWGVLINWVAGVQDLWMLAFALATLALVARDRVGWASLTMALGLLSKETAVVLPAIALAFQVIVRARGFAASVKRTLPMWICLLLWLFLYLQVLSQTEGAQSGSDVMAAGGRSPIPSALLSTMNLDYAPAPEQGWWPLSGMIALGALPLVGLLALGWRSTQPRDLVRATSGISPARTASFGASWAILGWLPLMHPSTSWHSYYALFGSLGAWLVAAVLLNRSRGITLAVIIALVALRAGRSESPMHDWGEQWYVRRAALLLAHLRDDLRAKFPSISPHSRLYFHHIPSESGFLVGDGPSLRIWYDDPTLRGHLWREFRGRESSAFRGEDRFFRYDTLGGWVEVIAGLEEVDASRRKNPAWREDHERLGRIFVNGEEWRLAFTEYAKLASAYPGTADYPLMAGLAALAQGDSSTAKEWIGRAVRLPTADQEARVLAGTLGVQ